MFHQVASNWADSFDILLDAYEQIGEQIPLLQQLQSLFEQSPHMRKVLELIYSDILEFHKRAIRFFSHRGERRCADLLRHTMLIHAQFGVRYFVQLGKISKQDFSTFWMNYAAIES